MGAMEQAYQKYPALRMHLLDESGAFRTHILCFVNDVNTREVASVDVPLKDGDEIKIVQAISGG